MSSNRKNRRTGCFLAIIGLMIIFAPYLYYWSFSDVCGPVRVWQFRKEADAIITDLVEAEKLVDQTGQMPSYMDVKLNQDTYQMGYLTVPACVEPAVEQLSYALSNGSQYLKWKPVSSGQIVEETRIKFETCMTLYYTRTAELDRCFPFCSMELSVFNNN